MGILRSDRVSGLGGANAITGSVFFGRGGTSAVASGNWLTAYSESDFSFGTGDFTIEYWFYFTGVSGSNSGCFQISNTVGGINNSNTAADGGLALDYENGCVKGIGNNGWFNGTNSVAVETWNHVALVRHSGTLQIFTNGVADTSASDSQNYSLTHLAIGGYYTNAYLMTGYISNFRIVKGTAVYSAAFTPPTERLTAIDGTVLLACQSPGNILQEETGKTLDIRKVNSNDAPPQASRFVPDKGENYGTTFEDNTRFNTLSYMVPPGGTTAESNRGRGLFGGGYNATAVSPSITYVEMQSLGNSVDFGDLSSTYLSRGTASCSSSTRGLFGGGYGASPLSTGDQNTIEYVTIATTSNSTNFGDMTIEKGRLAALSNNTRGLFGGGSTDPTSPSNTVNTIGYVTIASIGNAADFGDLTQQRGRLGATANTTRGLFFQGNKVPSGTSNVIDYVTIASAGNATDFGDALAEDDWVSALASPTRAIYCGGNINQIGYVTIATTGDAVDFGDLIGNSLGPGCTSNGTRGVINISYRGANVNNIEYITIASTGNAKDFGDVVIISTTGAACSDSHGGIS